MKDLGTFGGPYSQAYAVSNGQVVGEADTAGGVHAFIWTQAGGMKDLGTLGGDSSSAIAVSNGQVVGDSNTADGSGDGFIWTQAGGMKDFGTLGFGGGLAVPPQSATARWWGWPMPPLPSTPTRSSGRRQGG